MIIINNTELINGISLEKYAELLVKFVDTEDNEVSFREILGKEKITLENWKKAKEGWSLRMNDSQDKGKTTELFMPLYQAALERKYYEKEPCTLEEFTQIHCEITFKRDPYDSTKKINYEDVLKEHNITISRWGLYKSFWTPRVAMPKYHDSFVEQVLKNSERLLDL